MDGLGASPETEITALVTKNTETPPSGTHQQGKLEEVSPGKIEANRYADFTAPQNAGGPGKSEAASGQYKPPADKVRTIAQQVVD